MAKKRSLDELSDPELMERVTETKAELFNLRFQHATGQLDDYSRIKQVKKEVARSLTELRDREIAAAEALASQSTTKGSA